MAVLPAFNFNDWTTKLALSSTSLLLNSFVFLPAARSHLMLGSLRQTQFSGQFCHGLHVVVPMALMHVSVDTAHPPLLLASLFSQVVSSPESFFRHILGLVSPRVQTTAISLSCISVIFSTFNLSPWCYRFSHCIIVCGRMPIYTSSSLSLPCQSLHVGASHRYCLHEVYIIAGWTIVLWIFQLTCGDILLSHIGPPTFSSRCSTHTVSYIVHFCIHVSIALQGASQIYEFGEQWQLGRLHINTSWWRSIQVQTLPLAPSFLLSSPGLLCIAPIPARISPLRTSPHDPRTASSTEVLLFWCFPSVNPSRWHTGLKGWKRVLGGGQLSLQRVRLFLQHTSLLFRADSKCPSPVWRTFDVGAYFSGTPVSLLHQSSSSLGTLSYVFFQINEHAM